MLLKWTLATHPIIPPPAFCMHSVFTPFSLYPLLFAFREICLHWQRELGILKVASQKGQFLQPLLPNTVHTVCWCWCQERKNCQVLNIMEEACRKNDNISVSYVTILFANLMLHSSYSKVDYINCRKKWQYEIKVCENVIHFRLWNFIKREYLDSCDIIYEGTYKLTRTI